MEQENKNPVLVISRKSTFEMAHKLCFAQTLACNCTTHGHTYEWELSLHGKVNRFTGMVLDYSVLKKIMKTVESYVDHALWIPKSLEGNYKDEKKLIVSDCEPTAEEMCMVILNTVIIILKQLEINTKDIVVAVVRLSETKDTSVSFGIPTTLMIADVPTLPTIARWIQQ